MNFLRRFLGVIWMLLGASLAVYFPVRTIRELSATTATSEDFVFWIVVSCIFVPVMLGLVLFGYYAVKGEYSTSSDAEEEEPAVSVAANPSPETLRI